MDARTLAWIGVLIGSLVGGASAVAVLAVPRRLEPVAMLAGLIGSAGAGIAFVRLGTLYARPDAALWGLAILLAALGGGWAFAASLLEGLGRGSVSPASPEPGDPSEGVAVIIVACVEPATYSPSDTAVAIRDLTDDELLETSLGTLPFFFFAQKARYRAVGGMSPALSELSALAESLEPGLADLGVNRVAWARCSGEHSLAHRVADVVRAGFRRVVVVQLAVAESLYVAAAKRDVDALRLHEHGVDVAYTEDLGGSERLAAMEADRIMELTRSETSGAGVVLVGHAQPEERSRRNPAFDEQETSFLNRVRMLLVERGLAEAHVRLAWSEWREPDVTSAVRHLAALGCNRVIIAPVTFPLDTLGTRLDLELSVRQARVAEGVSAITMPAWKEHPALTAELRDRVKRALTD